MALLLLLLLLASGPLALALLFRMLVLPQWVLSLKNRKLQVRP